MAKKDKKDKKAKKNKEEEVEESQEEVQQKRTISEEFVYQESTPEGLSSEEAAVRKIFMAILPSATHLLQHM